MNARKKAHSGTQRISKARRRKLYLKGADFLLDLAKLVFGGGILAGIIEMDINKLLVVLIASCLALALSLWGFILYFRGTKTD